MTKSPNIIRAITTVKGIKAPPPVASIAIANQNLKLKNTDTTHLSQNKEWNEIDYLKSLPKFYDV